MSLRGPGGAWTRLAGWLGAGATGRAFEAFQIEVTTRCTLRCRMCPRTILGAGWPEVDLPWGAFLRIARAFDRVRHVHLQGWGEPLLHPRLADMAAVAKRAGCRVGVTTNGAALDGEMARRLLALDVDLVAVSVAGATGSTHAAIRVGSDLAGILENVRRLLALRRVRRKRTKVEFSYLMTRNNLWELPRAVEVAADLGVDEVYATNLDCVLTAEQAHLAAFGGDPDSRRHVDAAGEVARRRGVAFRPYALEPTEQSVCEANPLKMLFIAADGSVSPCTYMGLATGPTTRRWFRGTSSVVPRLQFGNVAQRDILEIWEGEEYAAFRSRFARRQVGAALSLLTGPAERPATPPDPPDPCRSCYKLYGL
jgi:MoaA/NifB/PqqE/SkfB family radical SAM enzyme